MSKRSKEPTKDPRGGLTAAGRAAFKKSEGAELRPGVKSKANTPEKMRRKGSFLRRHFANPRGPMVDDSGEPTRLALSAHAWGEPVPKTLADAAKLAKLGTKLLDNYSKVKASGDMKMKKGTKKKSSSKKSSSKKSTSTSASLTKSSKKKNSKKGVKSSKKKSATKKSSKKSGEKNSLVANINRRKKAGKSRPKSKGTVSKESYKAMKEGWK